MYTIKLKNQTKSVFLNKSNKINSYTYSDEYLKKKGHYEFKIHLKNLLPFSESIQEMVYCVLNDIHERPKCECLKPLGFEMFSRGFRQYCSVKCRANSLIWEKTKQKTNLKKYGVKHIAQLPEERIKRSKLLKTCDRSSWDYSRSAEKSKNTILERYGDVNTGWLSNGRETRIKNNFIPYNKEKFIEYKHSVRRLTELNDLSLLENHQLRDNHCYNENAYHLDHIVSIVHCFNAGVHPSICASIHNLRFIPWRDNLSKWANSDMSINELLRRYHGKIL